MTVEERNVSKSQNKECVTSWICFLWRLLCFNLKLPTYCNVNENVKKAKSNWCSGRLKMQSRTFSAQRRRRKMFTQPRYRLSVFALLNVPSDAVNIHFRLSLCNRIDWVPPPPTFTNSSFLLKHTASSVIELLSVRVCLLWIVHFLCIAAGAERTEPEKNNSLFH